jgi:hypothetical protein
MITFFMLLTSRSNLTVGFSIHISQIRLPASTAIEICFLASQFLLRGSEAFLNFIHTQRQARFDELSNCTLRGRGYIDIYLVQRLATAVGVDHFVQAQAQASV